jgi:predicted DNA-binding transcriptional regulator AlpA
MTTYPLQPTAWLAKRLGLSVSTIERLRARGEGELPPHLVIGRHSIRYDARIVEEWLAARQQAGVRDAAVAPANSAPVVGKPLLRKRLIKMQNRPNC